MIRQNRIGSINLQLVMHPLQDSTFVPLVSIRPMAHMKCEDLSSSSSLEPFTDLLLSFVYGGWGGNLGTAALQYDTINILTLPAFHWISVPYNPQNPRHAHTCEAVGGSQIISIGGVDSNSQVTTGFDDKIEASTFDSAPDPNTQGLAIFDMTFLEWADKYTANAPPYEQSDEIKEIYANPQQYVMLVAARFE